MVCNLHNSLLMPAGLDDVFECMCNCVVKGFVSIAWNSKDEMFNLKVYDEEIMWSY